MGWLESNDRCALSPSLGMSKRAWRPIRPQPNADSLLLPRQRLPYSLVHEESRSDFWRMSTDCGFLLTGIPIRSRDGTGLAYPGFGPGVSPAHPISERAVKSSLKQLGNSLAYILTAPVVLLTRGLYGMGADRVQVFAWVSQWAASWWGPLGSYCRRAVYRALLEECGPDVCISFGTIFSRPGARLGRRVYLGAFCNIGLAYLEDDVLLGSSVHVLSGKHQHSFERDDLPIREQGGRYECVRIGKGSWLGNCSIVMADVGEGCVVAAGSVVTRPVEDGAIVGGNPARVLSQRSGSRGSAGDDS